MSYSIITVDSCFYLADSNTAGLLGSSRNLSSDRRIHSFQPCCGIFDHSVGEYPKSFARWQLPIPYQICCSAKVALQTSRMIMGLIALNWQVYEHRLHL